MKREYYRHLPHQVPAGYPIFVTFNLKGALPHEVLEMLERERRRLREQPKRPNETPQARNSRRSKRIFSLADNYLDSANDGPLHLKEAAAAKIVEDSICYGAAERYDLFAWCVMANHVHILLQPRWELKDIMQGIKGFTAHEINTLHGARGRTFWQDESYDHWARDDDEFLRIIAYIENNPVSAGLCEQPADWQWSSARRRRTWVGGEPYRHDCQPRNDGLR